MIALLVAGRPSTSAEFIFGAALSFLKKAEEGGAVLKDGGQAKPGLRIFKEHGYGWIRLRRIIAQ